MSYHCSIVCHTETTQRDLQRTRLAAYCAVFRKFYDTKAFVSPSDIYTNSTGTTTAAKALRQRHSAFDKPQSARQIRQWSVMSMTNEEFQSAVKSIYDDMYRNVLESVSERMKLPLPVLTKQLLGDPDNYLKAIIPSNDPVAEQERRRQVGARIKEIRQHIGLTQAEVAEKLGIAKQSVTNYESGKTDPSIRNLIALATVLGVSTDYLLGRTTN